VIDSTGAGHFAYADFKLCQSCPMASVPRSTLDFTLTSVSHGIASGSVTASSDSYFTGKPVTASLAAGSPGQLLQMTVAGLQELPFCNDAAEATGQCGA
jgi:hypothetical protein